MTAKQSFGILLVLVAIFLMVTPVYVYATSASVLDIATASKSLDGWSTDAGSISLDTTKYYTAPSSIAWSTDIASNSYNSWLTYWLGAFAVWSDWSSTPVFQAEVNPQIVPSDAKLQVQLITGENGWTEYNFAVPQTITPNTWNLVSVNLASVGQTALQTVWAIRLNWVAAGQVFVTNWITNVDSLSVSASGGGTPTTETLTVQAPANGFLSMSPGNYIESQNTQVTITATANPGYALTNWVIDGAASGSSTTTSITMNTNHVVTAIFTAQATNPTPTPITGVPTATPAPTPGVTPVPPPVPAFVLTAKEQLIMFASGIPTLIFGLYLAKKPTK